MKITNLKNTEKTEVQMEGVKGAWRQVPLSKHDGAPNFSFRVFTVEPEGYTPHHSHAQEHLNYIISGRGVVVDENGTEREVKQGDFVMVLPGEVHQYRNNSKSEPLVFICAVPKEYE